MAAATHQEHLTGSRARAIEETDMTRAQRQVAMHVVRGHRSLRRRLPELGHLARTARDSDAQDVHVRTALTAGRFIEREVLVHADVEDAVVDEVVRRHGQVGVARRLQPQHDTLRDATARLLDFAEHPDDRIDVGGMVLGIGHLLTAHLDDEWQVLMPALGDLDETACGLCEPLMDAEGAVEPMPSGRLHVPTDLATADARLASHRPVLARRMAATATAGVVRAAAGLGVPLREDLGLSVELVPAVRGRHVVMHVGRLHSAEIETVLSPVDFELVLTAADGHTLVELHHALSPRRPVPGDAPAHQLSAAAVHAAIGELVADLSGRSSDGRRSYRAVYR